MKKYKASTTTLRHNKCYVGDTIETKILKLKANKEPVKDGSPIIYTERSQGVPKPFDIRTDRMEEALDLRTAMANKAVDKRGPSKKTDIGQKAAEGMKKEGETPATEANNN